MSDAVASGHAAHGPLVHHFADLDQQKDASTLGMWIFLVTEIMFFGGFFAAYAIYRYLYYDAFSAASHHLSWRIGFFNTLVLIGSSLTMAMAVYSAAVGKGKAIAVWIVLTILLGGTFLGVKYVEYREKVSMIIPIPKEPDPGPATADTLACVTGRISSGEANG